MLVAIINLRSAVVRRRRITSRLAELSIPYYVFSAVEAEAGFDQFNHYDEKAFLVNMGRRATGGEAACFASHRALWRRASRTRSAIVVLEDDAVIQDSFPEALARIAELIDKFGFIRLQNDFSGRHKRRVSVQRVGSFELNYYLTFPFGAMGYAISSTVATSFLNQSEKLSMPVDSFIKNFWEHGHPLYGLYPFTIEWDALSYESSIGARERERLDLRVASWRKATKLVRWVERYRFNLAHRPD